MLPIERRGEILQKLMIDGRVVVNELAEKYLNVFCTKTGINKKYVQRWIPIVAASQSVKAIPEEKEL